MKNDILQRVLLLLGLDKAKAFRNLDTANMAKFIALKYQLACSRGDTEKSPLHCAAAVAGVSIGGEELKTMKIPVVEGMAVCLDLVASTMVALILPATQSSGRVTQNSLAGSKRIANFMDSMFAIGLSKINRPRGRYIKQIKVRSTEMMYGETNVITAMMVKQGDFIGLEHTGYAWEREQLEEPDSEDVERDEAREEIRRRLEEGQTVRQICQELKMAPKTVCKLKKDIA